MAEALYLRVAFRGRTDALFAAVQASGVRLRRLRPTGQGVVFDVTPRDLRLLRRTLRGHGRLAAIGHGGWLLALRAIARSPWRLLLPVLGITTYLVLASFIWSVQVVGPPGVPRAAILRAAAADGLKRGSARFRLHPAALGEQIQRAVPGLIFCTVRIDGGRAFIWAAPAVKPPKPPPQPSQGALVAATDGYVTRVVTVRGVPLVRRGDTVIRGEPLILPRGDGALGSVYARVWRMLVYRFPKSGRTYVATGQRTSRWFVALGPGRILAPQGLRAPYRHARVRTWRWRIPGTTVELGRDTFSELRGVPVRYSESYARLSAAARARATVQRQLDGARMLSVRERIGQEPGALVVDVWVEAEVNIARTSAGERADY